MAKDIVMLSMYFDKVKESDLKFPMLLSEKLDGVMADLYKDSTGYHLRTRQNKELVSMQWFVDGLYDVLEEGEHLIGEMYHDYGLPRVANFNKISGRLRQIQEPASEIGLYVFDYYKEGNESEEYQDRYLKAEEIVKKDVLLHHVPYICIAYTVDDLLAQYDYYMVAHPEAEGVVCRPLFSPYKVGRSKGFIKIVPKPTVDLTINSIVEGKGEHVGQAGKVMCTYNGRDIAVGMGNITHDIRKDMYQNMEAYVGRTVEIKYKDITKDGMLRMPVVVRFREDKDD